MSNFVPTDLNNCLVMTRDQVRRFDSWAINELGVPGVVLMENAGRGCAEIILYRLNNIENPKVCIFCGTGNNGGDGFVIARALLNAGLEPSVVICGDRDRIKGDARVNLDIIEGMGLSIEELDVAGDDIDREIQTLTAGADMLIDALFGTGLRGELRGGYPSLVKSINDRNLPVVAVDIPSGLDCDTGLPLGISIRAVATVTFVAVKKGFKASPEASKYTGDVFVVSIGVQPGQKPPDSPSRDCG